MVHVMQVVLSLAQGGSEAVAKDVAVKLDRRRFRSSVCALDAAGPFAADLERAEVPVHVTGRRRGADWWLMAKLYRLFRRERVEIVVSHHLGPLIYSALGARLCGAVLVHVEHERFTFESARTRRRLRALAAFCHRIVVVGEDMREFFVLRAKLSPHKLTVIRNGVDLDRYTSTPTGGRLELGLPATGRLVGHVARLCEAKDQVTLLRAFRTVSEAQPDVRLVVVGDGPMRQVLLESADKLGVAKRVSFLGARKDVAQLLPHFDAFVLSSLSEGLPLALLEAMAAARPVVATAVGEVPALLSAGPAGVVVPPAAPAALAEALASVLEQPRLAAALGRAARAAVEERFELSGTVQQYERLFREVASKRAG